MTTDFARMREEQLLSRSRSSSQTTFIDSPSTPASPWDSARHSRFPSSASSISTSPTLRSSQDSFVPNRKVILENLPEIDEDAHQETFRAQTPPASRSPYVWGNGASRARPTSFFQRSEAPPRRDGFLSDHEGHWSKRRRSNEHSWNNFTAGVVDRFPSLSKKTRQRKRASMSFVDNRVEFTPAVVSPEFLHHPLSQRSSLNRIPSVRDLEARVERRSEDMLDQDPDVTENEEPQTAPGQIESMMQDFANESVLNFDNPESMAAIGPQTENEPRSTTPILPQLISQACAALDMASPLQAPPVATQSALQSESHTPEGSPNPSAVDSPVLSARPSVASIHKSHLSNFNNIAPLVMTDPADEWAEKLGHANFDILPLPYLPEHCDEASCRKLMDDWERARDEYAKHRSRTEIHFGGSSRTFKLTEEKWAAIDAQWRINNDLATRKAIENGAKPDQPAAEPAPVAKIPSIDDPRLLQSEDIPGPMKIEEPVRPVSSGLRRTKSKRAQFLKLFGGFQFPSKALGRATTASEGR